MAAKTQVAAHKQLYRELAHKQWLAKHLHGTQQQRDSLKQILILRTQLTQQTGKCSTR
jgi:hypothetical protein